MANPIVFFDLETTGIDVENDKIVEILMVKFPGKSHLYYRFNPEIPIPEEASNVHGIYDADVVNEKPFNVHATEIFEFIKGCDLAGYNSNRFDIPFLYNELIRSGYELDYRNINLIDVCNIFRIKEPHTLQAALQFYCNENHSDAHSAVADVNATCKVFFAQLQKYGLNDMFLNEREKLALLSNFDKPILDLSGRFTYDNDGEIIFTFGKNKGKKAIENRDYLQWMLKSDFKNDTKNIIYQILGE